MFMKLPVTCLVGILLSGTTPWACSKEDVALSPQFSRCASEADGSDAALMACNSQEWKRQDLRLNSAYQALMAKLGPAKKKELQSVQRLWLSYSQAQCGFYWDDAGFNGTLDRLVASSCHVLERARRADELESLGKRF